MQSRITNIKIFRIILLSVFIFSCVGAWAQNPTVSLSGGPCTGSTLTVTTTGTPTQIAFSLNGSVVSTSTSTATYIATSAGSYTATVTTATGSATTAAVTIRALTTPSITISAIPSSINICAGTNVSLIATITTGGPTPSYQWKKNNNPVGTNNANFSINTLANNDVISCTLTSNDACASPASASSNNITYTVNAPLTPSVSVVSYLGNSICSGTAALYVATAVNGGPTPSYQWYVNGVLMLTTSIDSFITTTLNNNDTVYCKMVTSVPCPAVETATSNKILMSVSTTVTPAATISATPGNTICTGTQVAFSATAVYGGSSAQYQWLKNGTAIPGANTQAYSSATLVNNDIISFSLTSNAICATAPTAISNSITMTVNPVGTPTVSIIPQVADSICTNDTVLFTATATLGGTAPLYTWMMNGITLLSLSPSNTLLMTGLNTNDTISVILTSNQPCATVTTATSNKTDIIVKPHVTMTLAITANPGASITTGDVVTFTAVATNAGPSYSYQWYVNGVAQAGSISPTYTSNTLANNDTVTCMVTSTEQCVTNPVVTSNGIIMAVANGVASISKGSISIGLSPNPNTGSFNLKGIVNTNAKEVRIEIYNLVGQVVYYSTTSANNGNIDKLIALPANTPNGLYQLKLITSTASEVLKFTLNK